MKRYVRLQIAFPLRIRANIIVIVDLFVSNDIKKQSFSSVPLISSFDKYFLHLSRVLYKTGKNKIFQANGISDPAMAIYKYNDTCVYHSI